MRLTVLGSAGSRPGPGRACSSYLVQAQGYRLLVDCGNGSLSNLLQVCTVRDIDAVLVSHRHLDHWADLVGIYLDLAYGPEGERASVPVYGPSGLDELVAGVVDDRVTFGQVCRFTGVAADDRLDLGPFAIELFAARHPVETLAARLEADGRVLAYSGDSAPCPELTVAAKDADVFLADATWPSSAANLPPGMHMTGTQVGRQAAAAQARRLLVTHVWPSYDPLEIQEEAAVHFSGPVEAVADGQVVDV